MSDTEAALLRAICAEPWDDTVRLAYADEIEDNGKHWHAKLIREQIERPTDWEPWDALHPDDWKQCQSWLKSDLGGLPIKQTTVRRGFVSEIRCTLAEFVGGKCGQCEGGQYFDDGGYSYSRNVWHECHKCNGTGTLPGLAQTLFDLHPITEVHISDFNPSCWASGPEELGGREWVWERSMNDQPNPEHFTYLGEGPFGGGADRSSIVPPEIFDTMEGESAGFLFVIGKHAAKRYLTRESALSALSTVYINYARSLHGYLPLTQEQV